MGSPKPRHMTRPVEEDEVLERIRGMVGNGIEAFGLRDDAAVLGFPGGGPLVASVDSVVEGVHVDLSLCSPGDVGWKALMGALSDLAAMGATPARGAGGAVRARRVGRGGAGPRRSWPAWPRPRRPPGARWSAATCRRRVCWSWPSRCSGRSETGGRPPVARAGARPGDIVLVDRALRRVGGGVTGAACPRWRGGCRGQPVGRGLPAPAGAAA